MASVNVTLSSDVYDLLKKLKRPGESFTDVIRRTVRPPADTCGELLERLEEQDAVPVNVERMDAYLKQRGRRSRRRR
jgi:predicted CopG family antitoxin